MMRWKTLYDNTIVEFGDHVEQTLSPAVGLPINPDTIPITFEWITRQGLYSLKRNSVLDTLSVAYTIKVKGISC